MVNPTESYTVDAKRDGMSSNHATCDKRMCTRRIVLKGMSRPSVGGVLVMQQATISPQLAKQAFFVLFAHCDH